MPKRIDKDFKKLDFDKVKGKNWRSYKEPHPFKPYTWYISHTADDGTETRYEIPRLIGEMLVEEFNEGVLKAQKAIRKELGINI